MFGLFDFKDALKSVFDEKHALLEAPLSILKNQKLAIDGTIISAEFLKKMYSGNQSMMPSYRGTISDFTSQLKKANIDFTIVLTGNFFTNNCRYLDNAQIVNRLYWKCLYFQSIYQSIENENEKQAKIMNNIKVLILLLKDNLIQTQVNRYYEIFQPNIFNEFGIDFVKAPRLKESQILWLVDNSFVSAIASSPLMFIYPNVDQVISHFDFTKQSFHFYDINILAKSYNISVEQIKACFLALACFFVLKIEKGGKLKLATALTETHSKITVKYEQECTQNALIVKKLLEHFSALNSDSASVSTDALALASEFLDIPKKLIENLKYEFFSSQIITDKAEFSCYPGKKPLAALNYCFNTSSKNLLVFYCMDLLSDSVLFLLSSNFKNTWVYPPTYIINFQTIQMKSGYIKDNLERSLFKILSLRDFKTNDNHWFWPTREICSLLRTDFMYLSLGYLWDTVNCLSTNTKKRFITGPSNRELIMQGTVSKISRSEFLNQEIYSISCKKSSEQVSTCQAFLKFATASSMNAEPITYLQDCVCSVAELSLTVNLMVLEELGYLNTKNTRLTRIGEFLLKSVSAEFFEEIILVFELVRIDMFDIKLDTQILSQYDSFNLDESDKESRNPSYSSGQATPKNAHHSLQDPISPLIRPHNELINTLKLNLLESRVCIVEQEKKEFIRMFTCLTKDASLPAKIAEMVNEQSKRRIEFISKFFLMIGRDTCLSGLFDYESCLFFEKLHMVLLSMFNLTTTSLALLFTKTGTRNHLHLATSAFRKLPFIRIYSMETGVLFKKLLTNFLIWRILDEKKIPFANQYKRQLFLDKNDEAGKYGITFSELVKKSFQFFRSNLNFAAQRNR